MDSLFNIEPEKYWQFTAKYTPEQKKVEIKNRISSNEYIGSEKIDGHYNKLVVDFDGKIRMESRTKSTVTGEYSDKNIPNIIKTMKIRVYFPAFSPDIYTNIKYRWRV